MNAFNFTEKFLEIANNRSSFVDNNPAQLIFAAIDWYAHVQGLSVEEAIARLSTKPNFGESGQVGGVLVYQSESGKTGQVKYVTHDECDWMNLYCVVEQAISAYPNDQPDWFQPEWAQTRPDDFFAQAA